MAPQHHAANRHASPNRHVSGTNAAIRRYAFVRQEVHAAFEFVALSLSCTLPMLLEETRRRGLSDDDVRTVLTIDEQDVERGIESDMHLRCFRSNAGTLYLTRDTAARNDAASSFEAFVELWRKGSRRD